MLGLGMQHGGVGPAGGTFLGNGRRHRLFVGLQGVDHIAPGAGSDHAFVLHIAHLHRRVMPVAMDQRLLLTQQFQHRLVLGFVEFVGVLDAQLRLGRFQVQRRVGDVDRPVVSLHPSFVRLAVRQVLRLEDHAPTGGCFLEYIGVVQQYVGAPLVRGAEHLIVHHIPGAILQTRVKVLPVRDQRGVDRLNALAGNQAQRGVARGSDQVVTALGHQADHFIGGGGGLDADLATGFLLETADPVVGLVTFTALDVAGPGNDIQLAFAVTHRLERLGGLQAGAGQQGGTQNAEQCGLVR
ncbi:hypothetical protein D3C76_1102110 [compost metagenome]